MIFPLFCFIEESKEEAKPKEKTESLDKDEKIDIDLNDPKTSEAAIKIQAGFRGHKTREELKQKKEEDNAAVKIQSGYRGMKAREEVKELRESKSQESVAEKASEKPEDEKKADIQESANVAAEKPAENADGVDINLSDPEVQDAALKIQASFRGYKAREEVKTLKSQPSHSGTAESEPDKKDEAQGEQETTATAEGGETVAIDLNDPEVQEAALKIQSSFRGYKVRESVKSMRSQESNY